MTNLIKGMIASLGCPVSGTFDDAHSAAFRMLKDMGCSFTGDVEHVARGTNVDRWWTNEKSEHDFFRANPDAVINQLSRQGRQAVTIWYQRKTVGIMRVSLGRLEPDDSTSMLDISTSAKFVDGLTGLGRSARSRMTGVAR